MPRVVGFGEMLLRLKSPGAERLLQTPRLEATFGGAEFNVLASLAQFGLQTAYVSVLPDNAIGAMAQGELRRFGIDTAQVRTAPGRMGLYFLEAGAHARPARVLYDRAASAFSQLDPHSFDWPTLLEGASLLHVSGISAAVGDGPFIALQDAVQAAHRLGIRVSVDLNARAALWAAQQRPVRESLETVIGHARVLFAGPADWSACLAAPLPQAQLPAIEQFHRFAAAVLERHPALSAVVTTLRAGSADEQEISAVCLPRAGNLVTTGPRPLQQVVDRIGSGDAFVAGFLYGKLQDWTWAPALEFGLAAGVLKHTIAGDVNRVTVREIEELLAGVDGARVQR